MDAKEASEPEVPLAAALKALAHPRRLRLLRFVTEPRSLEEIASELKVARQSAQEHLDQLVDQGLIEPQRGRGDHGPVTQYVVAVTRVFDVYDRLGTRLGLLSTELDEDVHVQMPTSQLAASATAGQEPAPSRLIIVHGMRVGQTVPLEGGGPWLVGRDPSAALCLDYDPYVSHRHAEVRRGGNGFELVDALSSNGIFVDFMRVRAAARFLWRTGRSYARGRRSCSSARCDGRGPVPPCPGEPMGSGRGGRRRPSTF